MKKLLGIIIVSAVSMFAIPASSQFWPDFVVPKNTDQHIFDNWTPPKTTGPAQRDCYSENDYDTKPCAATTYFWDSDYAHTEEWVPKTPRPLNTTLIAEFEKKKSSFVYMKNQSFWLGATRAYLDAHQWGPAMANLNEQIKVWYSSPIAYLMRANIETLLDRDDLAIQDLLAAKYWLQNGKNDYSSSPMREILIYGSLFEYYVRHNDIENALRMYGQIPTYNKYYLESDPQTKKFTALYAANKNKFDAYTANKAAVAAKIQAEEKAKKEKEEADKKFVQDKSEALKLGLNETEFAQLDAQMKNFGNECKGTALLEKAVSVNFNKAQTYPMLLEMNELCDNFTAAQKMRDDNPNIAGMPYIKNSKPFQKSSWLTKCDQDLTHLQSALKANYQVFHIGKRMGKFYLNCGRPKDAIVAFSAAKNVGPNWEKSKNWGKNVEEHELSIMLAQAYLMDKNIEKAVSIYADMVGKERINSGVDYGDEQYEKRLSEAKSLLMRADIAGINSDYYKLDKIMINTAYDTYYEGKQKWAEANKLKEENEKQCAAMIVSYENFAEKERQSLWQKSPHGQVATYGYMCTIANSYLSETNLYNCDYETKNFFYNAMSTARSNAGAITKDYEQKYGEHIGFDCH